jgi:hypothetical protein
LHILALRKIHHPEGKLRFRYSGLSLPSPNPTFADWYGEHLYLAKR